MVYLYDWILFRNKIYDLYNIYRDDFKNIMFSEKKLDIKYYILYDVIYIYFKNR